MDDNTSSKGSSETLRNTHCSSYKTKFAYGFLRSLMRLKKQHQPNLSSSSSSRSRMEIQKQSQRIKLLAYSSIAHAGGPRRAWSRAILFKLQTRARHRYFTRKRSTSLDSKAKKKKKKKRVMRNNNIDNIRAAAGSSTIETKRLREVVPGGKEMDDCRLFDETADYIKWLSMQVQLMQAIALRFSK